MNEQATPEQFEVRWGSATHPGLRRSENEDSLLARRPVFLVADGMGGHQRGRDASEQVIRAFDQATNGDWLTVEALNEATATAVELVRALGHDALDAAGSTVSGLGLAQHDGCTSWLVFNIGDSRTYRLQGTSLEQVTVDHSQVQELRDSGVPDGEARATVPSNVITRAIGGGMRRTPQADQWLLPAEAGDRMLICSDGLTDELTDQLITAILQSFEDPDEAAHQLVEAALDAGGHDNVTAIVLDAVNVSGGLPQASHDHDTVPSHPPLEGTDRTVPDLPVVPVDDPMLEESR